MSNVLMDITQQLLLL